MDGSAPRRPWPGPSGPAIPFLALSIAAAIGCARPAAKLAAQPAVRSTARVAQAETVAADSPGGTPQERAQRSWCSYLEALYGRSTRDGTSWGRFDECVAHLSTASPIMLQHTADCSRKALDGIEGDPLTAEYAGQVRRCGTEAIEAAAVTVEELEPLVVTLCERAVACGSGTYADCRIALDARMETRLGRAVGAINVASRDALRTCLKSAACDEPMSERVTGCLEPIMDRLLWLPPGAER
jgi:hypothetical protein